MFVNPSLNTRQFSKGVLFINNQNTSYLIVDYSVLTSILVSGFTNRLEKSQSRYWHIFHDYRREVLLAPRLPRDTLRLLTARLVVRASPNSVTPTTLFPS